jgi:hypothetical protein
MKASRILQIGLLGLLAGPAGAYVTWQAEPPVTPKEAPLLKVVPSPLSYDLALRRFRSYGGSADAYFLRSPRGVAIQSGDQLFLRDRMGTEFFGNTARMMAETPGEADPIPDAAAIKAAETFFSKTNPVMFKEAVLDRVRHLMNQVGDIESGRVLPPTQDETIVVFKRQIQGIDVLGPLGDGAAIHVDNFGHVTGLKRTWRNVVIVEEKVPILPWENVRTAFLHRMDDEMDPKREAIVKEIRFGYFSRPEGQPQEYMQPAFLFDVVFPDPETRKAEAARHIVLPAVQSLREPLELPDGPSMAGDPSKIVIDVARPKLPGSAYLYSLVPDPVNMDVLISKANARGMSIDEVKETPLGIVGLDKSKQALLTFDANGAETFAFLERMMREKPGELPPISDELANRRAFDHIGNFQDINLDEIGPVVYHHLMHQAGDTKGGEPEPPTQDETIVEFRRQIPQRAADPVPCIGPGAFYQVHVDNAGVVTGHNRMWRRLGAEVGLKDLRGYAEIEGGFIRSLASELGRNTAIVKSIEFGYYFRGRGFRQSFLQPAVLYTVEILDPETKEVISQRSIVEPAGRDLLEPLEDPEASDVPPSEDGFRNSESIPARFGDVNGDGQVDAADVGEVLRMAAGLQDTLIPPAQFAAGDVAPSGTPMGDGQLTINDAERILRSIFGLDDISGGV